VFEQLSSAELSTNVQYLYQVTFLSFEFENIFAEKMAFFTQNTASL
jgi:hypothetical protein